MRNDNAVRIAATSITDSRVAIRTLLAELDPTTLSGIILFLSSHHSLAPVAAELAKQRRTLTVIGCTTSGEISPLGWATGSMVAIGFPSAAFGLKAVRFDDLDAFDSVAASGTAGTCAKPTSIERPDADHKLHQIAILFIDGLSCREELLASALQAILWPIHLIGASSGDDMAFRRTFILHENEFRDDSAVLAILSSVRPLKAFRSALHVPTPRLVVVTQADPVTRQVHELNGENAAEEYARLIGVTTKDLSPTVYAAHPLLVKVAGEYFARSIQGRMEGGSLVFHSAIACGVVMRLGERLDSLEVLQCTVDTVRGDIPEIDAILMFESALNKVDAVSSGLSNRLAEFYAKNRTVGFHTYGEQFTDVHLNQNVVGVAIGRSAHAQ